MRVAAVAILFLSLAFTGCSVNPTAAPTPTSGLSIHGSVRGGQQPVSAAKIQLYAVGTAGDGSSGTPLISATVTTSDGTGLPNSNANAGNANNTLPIGAFTITGDYTCPTASTQVYLVATGGNPGLASGTNNTAIAMMAALGLCSTLNTSTYIVIDEVTTVGSLAALYPYMNSATQLGSGPSDSLQLATAFELVNQYINTTTGTTPGPALPPGFDPSSLKINTIADIVAACVNSVGGSAGNGSPCGDLFAGATPPGGPAPTSTIEAVLDLLNYPQQNVGILCPLATPTSPFQPSLSCPPISWLNWTLPIIPATPSGELEARATANQSAFYVFKDQDSGFNHGFPSGFFASNPENLATIHLDAGCIDNPVDLTTGCYPASATALDTVRGTVLRISFDRQSGGNFAGLNIEEPEDWGVVSTNTVSPQCGNPNTCYGYNLSGATAVTFDVRSPNSARVQFGVGGCLTGFTQPIPLSWTRVTLTLGPPDLSCPPNLSPNLSNLNILFSVQTNDFYASNGATVLLDNIQFTPVPQRAKQSGETLSLPYGTQTFGVVPNAAPPLLPNQVTPPFPPDQVNRNLAPIYESALTLKVLLNQGSTPAILASQQIADGLDYVLYHDNQAWYIPTAPNVPSGCYMGLLATQCGLHNAYENGDLGFFNDQNGMRGSAKAGDAKLAGFTCSTALTNSASDFCLVLDGATGGNNAWAILALLAEYKQSGDPKYLHDAITIGNWIIANLTDTTGIGYGGYYVGYPDQGVPPPKLLNMGKSTENNADIFAAFMALSTNDTTHAAAWISAANIAGDFVMNTFDPVKGHFNVGTVPFGTSASDGVCPGTRKGNDQLNTCDFLDSDTFTTLAIAGSPRYANVIDWTLPIQYVLNHFAQMMITAGPQTFSGFDLVQTPVSGANGIAWEFTAQAVETMRYVDQITHTTTFELQAASYVKQMQLAQQLAPFDDNYGVVASTLQGGDVLPPLQQCLSTPFQNCPAERVGIAATAWMVLAEQGINPLLGP